MEDHQFKSKNLDSITFILQSYANRVPDLLFIYGLI